MITLEVRCDICGSTRQKSNGWSVSTVEKQNNSTIKISFQPWDQQVAEYVGASHLCSSDCEAKFLMRNTSTWRENHKEN